MKIYRVHLDTKNYFLEAYGNTEASALKTMQKTLMEHFKKDPQRVDQFLKDCNVLEIEVNSGYRDTVKLI